MRRQFLILIAMFFSASLAHAQIRHDYLLSPGDTIRVTVFQSPEMTTETRIPGNGQVALPLIGAVMLGGLSVPEAESRIAQALKTGGFVINPGVSIMLVDARGSQVSVLGQVNKPGRYSLDVPGLRISDLIATAGGVSPTGGDVVLLTGTRDGQPIRMELNLAAMMSPTPESENMLMASGDTIFVKRAPMFFIYGEVQKAGSYRLDPNMTVMQAIATGGGITTRGTTKGIQVHRQDEKGNTVVTTPPLNAVLKENDVVQVRERLF